MSRPLAGKKVQPPGGSVIGAPVTAATCSTVNGHRSSALAAGAGPEAAGAEAAAAAAGASTLFSLPPHAAADTNTIPAHIDRNSPDTAISVVPPLAGWLLRPPRPTVYCF